MGFFDSHLFSAKSKATQQQEQEAYEIWAFPHGQKQRDNLQSLLYALFPKQTAPTTLIAFLTCKELYESELKKCGTREAAIDMMISKHNKFRQMVKKKDLALYIALVIADADIDDRCQYPTADEIRARVQETQRGKTK